MSLLRWSLPTITRGSIAAVVLALVVTGDARAQGPPYTFTKIQVPGSTYTHAYGISNDGTVVGTYVTPQGKTRGFKWVNSTFTDIEYPAATHSYALGINDAGRIVGSHSLNGANGPWHSFLLADGQFTEFDPPTWESDGRNINNNGDIAGVYNAGGTLPTHGFVRRADGTFETIDYPGATYSFLNGINDAGHVSGAYIDASGKYHAYFRTTGELVRFAFPGAQATYAADVNNLGTIVGTQFQAGFDRGFVMSGSTFRSFDVPFAGVTHTRAWAVNDLGDVVGNYVAPDCPSGCGFLAVPETGVGTCQQTVTASYEAQTLTFSFTLNTTETTNWEVYAALAGGPAGRLWSVSLPPLNAPLALPISGVPPMGTVTLYSGLSTTQKGVVCADVALVDTGTP